MTNFADLLGATLRGLLKLALLAITLLFLLGLLLIGLVAAVFILLWSLLTGRKPALWTAFSMFRQASAQFRPAAKAPASADVVDVQAHEVGGHAPPTEPSPTGSAVSPVLLLTDDTPGAQAPPDRTPP